MERLRRLAGALPGWAAPASVILLAFALRVIYVLQQGAANPLFDAPVLEPRYYVEWARALASGQPYYEGPFFRAPLYPWFLGILFALFGEGYLLPRLVQAAWAPSPPAWST